jgi:hypothetical protein
MSITKKKFLIRCRETGLFYHPGVSPTACQHSNWGGIPEVDAYCLACGRDEMEVAQQESEGYWVQQSGARRLDKSNAVWYAEHLMENRHCVHIVPEGYQPEVETVFERVRNWFAEIYHMFRH